jgi:hypothetical protein
LHSNILVKPIASLIVGTISAQGSRVVAPIDQEDPKRLLLGLPDDIRICVSSTQVDKAANIAEDLAEVIRSLPRHGKRRDRAGA